LENASTYFKQLYVLISHSRELVSPIGGCRPGHAFSGKSESICNRAEHFGSAFETCKTDISLNWVAINMYQCDIPCSSQGYIKDM
jgi:hypothetical protein